MKRWEKVFIALYMDPPEIIRIIRIIRKIIRIYKNHTGQNLRNILSLKMSWQSIT